MQNFPYQSLLSTLEQQTPEHICTLIYWGRVHGSHLCLSGSDLALSAPQATWLKQDKPTLLLGDNQGAIALTKNPGNHPCTKHIQLCYHFIWFAVDDGQIILDYMPAKDMVADRLTKGLTGEKHMWFVSMLSLKPWMSGSVRIWCWHTVVLKWNATVTFVMLFVDSSCNSHYFAINSVREMNVR